MIPLVREDVAPCRVSAPALGKIPDALFFRPRQQLVLRLKSPAAVRPVAVKSQVEVQAVWQKLDAAWIDLNSQDISPVSSQDGSVERTRAGGQRTSDFRALAGDPGGLPTEIPEGSQ